MSIFGMIMAMVALIWTGLTLLIIVVSGGIFEFFQTPALTTILIGYVIIIAIALVVKRLVNSV